MINKIKISLLVILAVLLGSVYAAGCLPEGLDLFETGSDDTSSGMEVVSENGQSDDEEGDIDSRLSQLKKGLVSAPVLLSHVSGEQIFGSGDRESIFVKGLAEPGNTIEVYVNGTLEQDGIIADGTGRFETISGIEIIEGKNVIDLVALDNTGNRSNPTRFDLFLEVPQKVEYALYNNSTELELIDGFYYTPDSKPMIYLKGAYIPGSTMYVQANDRIIGEPLVDDSGTFTLENIELETGANELAVWALTGEGYTSSPVFASITVFRDMITPFPSNLTGYHNQDANYIEWAASIDDNFDSYKVVRVKDPCINPEFPVDDVVATITDQNSISFIDDDLEDGRSYYYTVWTLDKAGHAVSSNVLALPKPDYTISIKKLDAFTDYSVNRREWFYQYYEITNNGNVTLDLQPIMVWIKLNPEPDEESQITPFWEAHIWEPETGNYYYSDEAIYNTYVSDYWKTGGYTTIDEETTYNSDNTIKTDTVTVTNQRTEETSLNQRRVMSTSTETTRTETDLTTGTSTVTTTTDMNSELVEPEKIGSLIEDLEPGEKIKIGVKIQNISAPNNAEIIVHFHFAPVDCDGYFYTDEEVSTLDIFCKSSGRTEGSVPTLR
jgi:hypothetical protein